jgi:phage shock protein A
MYRLERLVAGLTAQVQNQEEKLAEMQTQFAPLSERVRRLESHTHFAPAALSQDASSGASDASGLATSSSAACLGR